MSVFGSNTHQVGREGFFNAGLNPDLLRKVLGVGWPQHTHYVCSSAGYAGPATPERHAEARCHI
eukprot:5797752-Heterocapsa_arctica.AAC.1